LLAVLPRRRPRRDGLDRALHVREVVEHGLEQAPRPEGAERAREREDEPVAEVPGWTPVARLGLAAQPSLPLQEVVHVPAEGFLARDPDRLVVAHGRPSSGRAAGLTAGAGLASAPPGAGGGAGDSSSSGIGHFTMATPRRAALPSIVSGSGAKETFSGGLRLATYIRRTA